MPLSYIQYCTLSLSFLIIYNLVRSQSGAALCHQAYSSRSCSLHGVHNTFRRGKFNHTAHSTQHHTESHSIFNQKNHSCASHEPPNDLPGHRPWGGHARWKRGLDDEVRNDG